LVDELPDEMYRYKVFSKLILSYEFLVMPFRLTNSPSMFQGLVNKIFEPISGNLYCFFYDIVVYNWSMKEHVFHLKEVMQVL